MFYRNPKKRVLLLRDLLYGILDRDREYLVLDRAMNEQDDAKTQNRPVPRFEDAVGWDWVTSSRTSASGLTMPAECSVTFTLSLPSTLAERMAESKRQKREAQGDSCV